MKTRKGSEIIYRTYAGEDHVAYYAVITYKGIGFMLTENELWAWLKGGLL